MGNKTATPVTPEEEEPTETSSSKDPSWDDRLYRLFPNLPENIVGSAWRESGFHVERTLDRLIDIRDRGGSVLTSPPKPSQPSRLGPQSGAKRGLEQATAEDTSAPSEQPPAKRRKIERRQTMTPSRAPAPVHEPAPSPSRKRARAEETPAGAGATPKKSRASVGAFPFHTPKKPKKPATPTEHNGGDVFQFMGDVKPKPARDDVPKCIGHVLPMITRVVKKEGVNKGRTFYVCPNVKDQCNSFMWQEDFLARKQARAPQVHHEEEEEEEDESDGDITEEMSRLRDVKSWQEKLRKEVRFPFKAFLVRDERGAVMPTPEEVLVRGFSPDFGTGTSPECLLLCKKGDVTLGVTLASLSVEELPKGFKWLRAYPYVQI